MVENKMKNIELSTDTKLLKVAFIGHRQIFDKDLENRLYSAVETEIKNGCNTFVMGTHGDFDKAALRVCRNLRQIYKNLKIEVVITSLAQIKPIVTDHSDEFGDEVYKPYEDVETIMFDIENTYFKQKITESNKRMIDSCSTLICYVDTNYKYASGAKTAYLHAKKKGLTIVNLFKFNN